MAPELSSRGHGRIGRSKNLRDDHDEVLERVSDAIIAVDKDWKCTYLNLPAAQLFGRSPKDLVGKDLWKGFPEGATPLFHPAYKEALSKQDFVRLESYHEAWHQWYESRIFPSSEGLSIFLRDITEQKLAEQAAKESSELLHGQSRVLELIARGEPLQRILDTLLRIVEAQSPGMLASILLLDDDGIHVRHGAAPSLPQSYTSKVDGEPIGAKAGSCGTAAYRREAVIVEDIAIDPLWEDYRELALKHGLRACWSTPIFDDEEQVLGTFALYFRMPGTPSRHHLKQIEMGTHTASIAIVRHREREALTAAHERLRLALESGNVGVWERDLQNGRLIWSSRLKSILGYRGEEENLTFERFLESVHEQDRDHVVATVERAIAEHKDSNVEFRVTWPDGSVHWIVARGRPEYDVQGNPLFMRGVGLDVTERKRIEEEIKVREAQLTDAQHVANFGSYEWLPDTNTVRWTDELYRIFGLRPETFTPTLEEYLKRVHPEDRESTKKKIEDCVQNGTSFEMEERILRPDGAVRQLLSQGKWLFDENRLSKKLVGTCQDVTTKKESERSRSRLEAELSQLHKMESVGRLAGGVAHDFNNLLTVIFGHLAVCEEKLTFDDPIRGNLDQILKSAQRAATLTRHLLAFSRRQVTHPTVLDLNSVVNNLNKMMSRVLGEHIKLRVIAGESVANICADLGQVDQILMNLLVNAVDAMPKGGEIVVETANADLDKQFVASHPTFRPGRYVVLSVSDNGPGMDSETVSHIFEPFFTTKPPGEGTGLGLATVYGLVEQGKGHILVDSQMGKGTTFKIFFPRTDLKAGPDVPQAERALPKGSETVLLVEDDEALRKLATAMLTSHGYKVLESSSGKDALALAQEYEGEIHLVLTDVVMPEMNGPDLVENLRSKRPQIVVLYMSGYAGKLLSHQGVSGTALLPKPFTKRELLTRVSASLEKAA